MHDNPVNLSRKWRPCHGSTFLSNFPIHPVFSRVYGPHTLREVLELNSEPERGSVRP